jgi:hypothetical protein
LCEIATPSLFGDDIPMYPRYHTSAHCGEFTLVRDVKRRVRHRMAEQVRYGERSAAERVNGGIKDNHGGRTARLRGPEKMMCHLMFGILGITVLQLVRLIT